MQGSWYRDQGTGIMVQGSGYGDHGTEIDNREQGSGYKDQGTGIRYKGTAITAQGRGLCTLYSDQGAVIRVQ